MHHLLEHINRDIKKEIKQGQGLSVHKTEYQSKKIQQVNLRWACQQPKHQAITISSINKSLCRNRHRV